jgi:hypothetical protein
MEIHDENKKEYASKSLAGFALPVLFLIIIYFIYTILFVLNKLCNY